MKYRQLGNTDIEVSLIGLGSMTWGEQNTSAEAFEQMDLAVDSGINFFDAAEMYPIPPDPNTQGMSESIMGDWIAQKGCRDKIVLATKVTGRGDRNKGLEHIRNGARLNRQQITQALEDSLRRLKTDYVDLYQVHWPERATNFFGRLEYQHGPDDGFAIKEALSTLADLMKQGKIRHIGISNETPWGISEYLRLAREQSLPEIISIQNPYNLLNRTFDIGCSEFACREQVSLLAYSPLAFGILSGKYLNGQMPKNARLALYDRFVRYNKVNVDSAVEAYVKLAHEHDVSPVHMALAFINMKPYLASNIVGVTNLDQLKANIESVNVTLSKELLVGIEEIHQRYPNPAP